jgi:hypothetical protein
VLISVAVADAPEVWAAAGFAVADGSCQVGQVRLDLGADGSGLVAWGLSGVDAGPLDGLDTRVESPTAARPGLHPNGTRLLDHLVVMSHNVGRTRDRLERRGFEVRRTADMGDRRYTFFRVGEAILELVGPATVDDAESDRPARLFGLAFTVEDLDATVAHLGPLLGAVKDAVQPGRRIATLRREAGLSVPVAFMSPDPRPS